MKITYWSDFACPYCYIGNRRLKRAISDLGLEDEIELDIHAFELDQNAPYEVKSTTVERFAVKYNLSIENAKKEVDNISKLGIEEGIDFRYATTLYTNTRDAHRLMKYAQANYDLKTVDELSELLFDAYFAKNLKLANKKVLMDVAKKTGLDKKEIEELLNSNFYNDEVQKDEDMALIYGIHGVPFYLLDGKYSIPGALSYDNFKKVLNQIKSENEIKETDDADSCSDGVCKI